MVIDAAKGIESQTRKLFEVCRLRDIPIITFINKIDREGATRSSCWTRSSQALALDAAPIDLAGRHGRRLPRRASTSQPHVFASSHGRGGATDLDARSGARRSGAARNASARPDARGVPRERASLAREGCRPSTWRRSARASDAGDLRQRAARLRGRERCWPASRDLRAAAARRSRRPPALGRARRRRVSGFVFKVQANMDPEPPRPHRVPAALLGKLRRGMKLTQVRTGKPLTVHSPVLFFGQEREIAEDAVAGDVIGIPNHGALRVGDTLAEDDAIRFTGLPAFAPECCAACCTAMPAR